MLELESEDGSCEAFAGRPPNEQKAVADEVAKGDDADPFLVNFFKKSMVNLMASITKSVAEGF